MDDRDLLIRALVGVWAELPGLVGDDWPFFEATVLIRLRALEAASLKDVEKACDAVLAEFDAYPAARERPAFRRNLSGHVFTCPVSTNCSIPDHFVTDIKARTRQTR